MGGTEQQRYNAKPTIHQQLPQESIWNPTNDTTLYLPLL